MALADRWGDTKEQYGVPRDLPHHADSRYPAPGPGYPTEPPEIAHPSDLASPTTTARLEALMDSEHFPLMLAAAEVLFGTVFDWFTTSPEEELVEEQLDWAQLQRLRASGVFSEEDIAQIQAGFGPMVNAVAGNVGSRGLGGSAAGAEIIAQAQAAPFHRLQAQAAQLYQESLVNASKFITRLAEANAGYSRSFGNITKLYETMREENKENVQSAIDPMLAEFDELTRRFSSLLKELEEEKD